MVSSTGGEAERGTITLDGTGGNGTSTNYGFYLNGAGTLVTSVDGAIGITGIGAAGASGTDNDGIRLESNANILSGGAAEIVLTGTAGANASSEDITTLTGAIEIGGGAAAGDITFNFNNHSLANLSVETTGDIILQPRTAGTPVGVAGGAGALNLSAAVLGFMDWGDTLRIGRTDGSAAMTVNAHDWGARNVELRSGAGVISVNGAQTNLDDFTLTTDADPVHRGGSGGDGNADLAAVRRRHDAGAGRGGGRGEFLRRRPGESRNRLDGVAGRLHHRHGDGERGRA